MAFEQNMALPSQKVVCSWWSWAKEEFKNIPDTYVSYMCQWSFRQEFMKQRIFSYFILNECMPFFIWAACNLLRAKAPTNRVPAAGHGIFHQQNTTLPQCQLWKFFEMTLLLVLKPLRTPYPFWPVHAFPLVNRYSSLKHFPGIWHGKLWARAWTRGLNIFTWRWRQIQK